MVERYGCSLFLGWKLDGLWDVGVVKFGFLYVRGGLFSWRVLGLFLFGGQDERYAIVGKVFYVGKGAHRGYDAYVLCARLQ